jgi:hypothetical protein
VVGHEERVEFSPFEGADEAFQVREVEVGIGIRAGVAPSGGMDGNGTHKGAEAELTWGRRHDRDLLKLGSQIIHALAVAEYGHQVARLSAQDHNGIRPGRTPIATRDGVWCYLHAAIVWYESSCYRWDWLQFRLVPRLRKLAAIVGAEIPR